MRLVWPTVVLAAATLALVPVTTEAGEWLEHRLPRTPLTRAHAELGDGLVPWVAGPAVVAVVVAVRTSWRSGPGVASPRRTAAGPRRSRPGRRPAGPS
ncbi:hypothetical protein ACFU8R_21480 [Pseudonocardia alni]|uniref:Uncharacterized protein n=1 Tax=Pseudonocardia alni TaxID=33907 RepID=A0A852W6T4_PSEA5|nr:MULTISPECIES: hypothetical protein [Pseudonocardia]MCO7197030.1 hypothetical protein [Pseudonocardia sp. McavD-2-B]NYG01192.1 hypothetical protein [Pseudonocardia antarctica]